MKIFGKKLAEYEEDPDPIYRKKKIDEMKDVRDQIIEKVGNGASASLLREYYQILEDLDKGKITVDIAYRNVDRLLQTARNEATSPRSSQRS